MGYSPWGHKELDMTEQLNTFGKNGTSCIHRRRRVQSVTGLVHASV